MGRAAADNRSRGKSSCRSKRGLPRAGSSIGKHCSSSSCSLAMGNAFLLDGHTARFLSRERKWGVWSCGAHVAHPSARRAENPSSIFLTKNPQHGMLTTTKGSEKEAFSFHPLKRGDGRCKSLRNGKGGAFEPRGGNAAPDPPLQGNEVPRIQRGIQVEPRTNALFALSLLQ